MTTTTARGAALARKATGTGTGNAAPRRRRRPRSDLRVALFFIAPALLGFVAFYLVPSIRGVYLSFTEYSVLGDPTWIGTKNYTAIFADDLFWNAMAVTVQYVALNIGFQTVIALGLALLMHDVAKSTLIRGALLLPFLVANVIVALLWFWMLDYQTRHRQRDHQLDRACPASPSSAASNGPSPPSPASTSGATWATPPC